MNAEFQVIDLEIPPELAGHRLDSALARLLPQHSRTRIKGWIEAGAVLVGRRRLKPRDLVAAGNRVRVQVRAEEAAVRGAAGGDRATPCLRRRRPAGDRQAGRIGRAPRGGESQPYPAKRSVGTRCLAGEIAARRPHPSAGQGHQRPARGGAHR